MIWSKERQGSLAARIVERLRAEDGVLFEEDPSAVRRAVVRLLAECDAADDRLRQEAERKVTSMKRNVPAGSGEWEVLVRQHLGTEYDRLERFRVG